MIRKAKIADAPRIQKIINEYARQELMLPRSLNDIYENVRDFFVYEQDGDVVGCISLHFCWEDLAEIRSLAVVGSCQRRGIGKKLVETALAEAGEFDVRRVFTLTYVPEFFEKTGFRRIEKSALPHKVWGECVHCVKFPNCEEQALEIDLVDGTEKGKTKRGR